jgi:pyruvate,water dikinase
MIPLTKLFKRWTYDLVAPGTLLKEKYEAFKALLRNDKQAHELMAELEAIYHDRVKVDFNVIEHKYDALSRSVSGLVAELHNISPSRYLDLEDYFEKLDSYIRFMLEPPVFSTSPPFTLPLEKIRSDSQPVVGSKAKNLAVIAGDLQLPVPSGFVITSNAFHYVIEFNELRNPIDQKLSKLDIDSPSSLKDLSRELVSIVKNVQIPREIQEAVRSAFRSSRWHSGEDVTLVMRSSAVGEDTRASFAGQYRTVINVKEEDILDAYREVIASKYEPKALYYRISYGLSDRETPMAVIALEMVDAKASGITYTENLDNPASDNVVIHSIWGLGSLLVSGEASPDIIEVVKEPKPSVVKRKPGSKDRKFTFTEKNRTDTIPLNPEEKRTISLDDDSALALAQWGMKLETHYKEPQDIEWCMDTGGNLFVLQARPLQLERKRDEDPDTHRLEDVSNTVLLSGGEKACSGAGAGDVYRVERESDLEKLPDGAVLVAKYAAPQYVSAMGKIHAAVTDLGSTAGHFSSVAREFGVPTLVNTGSATADLSQGQAVTVHADKKVVYDGIVKPLAENASPRKEHIPDSPFFRKMRYIINFISPLKLVDPQSEIFVPRECRSLHDIIRFCHEKAIEEMFHSGDKRIRKIGGSKRLISEIPMRFYVVDVGGGLSEAVAEEAEIGIEDIKSIPMAALFKGLTHPDIHWGEFTHFDWERFDKVAMTGAFVSAESSVFASYAVASEDYLNVNMRFGYHFVIVDSICGERSEGNYILFRFAGGGGDFRQRSLRASFLNGVLERLGFEVDIKGDLVDGQLEGEKRSALEQKLDMVGRLMGATRLMDMYLKDRSMAEAFVDDFMEGRYHFASEEANS